MYPSRNDLSFAFSLNIWKGIFCYDEGSFGAEEVEKDILAFLFL